LVNIDIFINVRESVRYPLYNSFKGLMLRLENDSNILDDNKIQKSNCETYNPTKTVLGKQCKENSARHSSIIAEMWLAERDV
jgi:hypothetical protein